MIWVVWKRDQTWSALCPFNKHSHCKNVSRKKSRFLTMFQFCPCCLEFLQGDACWTLPWSTPGPTSFSKLVFSKFYFQNALFRAYEAIDRKNTNGMHLRISYLQLSKNKMSVKRPRLQKENYELKRINYQQKSQDDGNNFLILPIVY